MEGRLDLTSMRERKPSQIDFDKICRFLKFKPDITQGRLNNLCARPVTFANFDLKARSFEEFQASDAVSIQCERTGPAGRGLKRRKAHTATGSVLSTGRPTQPVPKGSLFNLSASERLYDRL